ncbi:MAG TPA: type II toxin-antitoxin system prevent-host-death family antitoxin [Acidimicrobiales bacterium]|nr:type II toxin-antitoxin system prevent-host-death family antitoxin [Acidimicrobiales bacterium]
MGDGRSQVGIRELRNNVAAVVRRAAAGERILVTSDGAPVAMLGPVEPAAGVSLDDLIAAGLARPPGRPDHPVDPEAALLPVDVRTDRVLDEIRGG